MLAQPLHLFTKSAPRQVRQPHARGVSSYMTYQRKAQSSTNQEDEFDSLFDYNVFITIYVPQRFGKPQQVQWCVFAITPTTHRLRSSSSFCVQVPSIRSKEILDDRSFTKSVTILWRNLQDDIRSCQSLTFIQQGPLIEPSCEII